jgi:hypothetical protein
MIRLFLYDLYHTKKTTNLYIYGFAFIIVYFISIYIFIKWDKSHPIGKPY